MRFCPKNHPILALKRGKTVTGSSSDRAQAPIVCGFDQEANQFNAVAWTVARGAATTRPYSCDLAASFSLRRSPARLRLPAEAQLYATVTTDFVVTVARTPIRGPAEPD